MSILRTISAAAREANTSESMIRYLDQQGVIKPQRDSSNRRLLTDTDIQAIKAYLASKQQKAA